MSPAVRVSYELGSYTLVTFAETGTKGFEIIRDHIADKIKEFPERWDYLDVHKFYKDVDNYRFEYIDRASDGNVHWW